MDWTTKLAALCALLVAGCGHAEQASPKAATAAPAESPAASASHHQESPIRVTLQGPAGVPPRGELALTLRIERNLPTLAPIALDLKLPAGVTLVSGQGQQTLTDTTSTVLEPRWVLRYDAVPPDDAVIVVDWQTQGAGFHAEVPYRFGRPAPKPAAPARLPTEVRLPGGTSLGRPILTR